MASRNTGGVRVVQRKLRKIVKDLLDLEELQIILEDDFQKTPAMDFLVDIDSIDKYGEDVLNFKSDAETCFKYFAKLRGKRQIVNEIAETFQNLLEQSFPEIFGDNMEEEDTNNRKRRRSDANEENENNDKKRTKTKENEEIISYISSNQRKLMKKIITSLSKSPGADPFVYPVNKKEYPEYYELIKKPMDLKTVGEKVAEYENIEDFVKDVGLIWENCRKFNEDGSEILLTCDGLSDTFNAFVEENFGPEYVKRKKQGKRKNPTDPSNETSTKKEKKKRDLSFTSKLTKKTMKEITQKLMNSENAEYFILPVDVKNTPGYLDMIKTPMNLKKVLKKVNAGEYDENQGLFDADMKLIWENCVTYNEEGSEIVELALELSKEYEQLLEELTDEKNEEKIKPRKKVKNNENNNKEMNKNMKISKRLMKEIIHKMKESEFIEPFLLPVDVENTPNYSDIVETPMDFQTLSKKVNANEYAENQGLFINDMSLIWENCIAYNEEGSDIVKFAEALKNEFEELWQAMINPSDQEEHAEELSAKKKSKKEEKNSISDIQVHKMGKKDMKEIVQKMKESAFSEPFLLPVDVENIPNYSDIVETPMDFQTLLKKVNANEYTENQGLFINDMSLIWENCIAYNEEGSDIVKFAEAIGKEFEMLLEELGFKTKVSEGKEDFDADGEGKKGGSENLKKMKKLLRELFKHELSPPFQKPLKVDQIPGYLDVVKKPMDLSTVKANLPNYEDNPISTFLADILLIFENCQKFNVEDSDIYKTAEILKNFTVKRFSELFTSTDTKSPNSTKGTGKPRGKYNKNKNTPVPLIFDSSASGLGSASTGPFSTSGAGSSKPSLPATITGGSSYVQAPAGMRVPSAVSSLTSSLVNIKYGLTKDPQQLKDLANDLVDKSTPAGKKRPVRVRAAQQAFATLKSTKLPFVLAPELYEVQKFGDIFVEMKCHSKDLLSPLGFSCSRVMRLCVVPETKEEEGLEQGSGHGGDDPENGCSVLAFVPVEMKSSIVQSIEEQTKLSFEVCLQNGTVLSTGTTPRAAWEGIFGHELETLQLLGSRLKRCRCVFNRLCVSPCSLPFFEQVPSTGPNAVPGYYEVVKAPMWMREVHKRLKEGTYDNEFDFAWDMRLIFKNCLDFNIPGSQLYLSAERMLQLFENLLISWVYNVQDRSLTDLAKGSWDSWSCIRYFDAEKPEVDRCVLTGTEADKSLLMQCQWCGDQYLKEALNLGSTAGIQVKDWNCGRCSKALELSNGDLSGEPFAALGPKGEDTPYNTEQFGNTVWVHSPEVGGSGWCQAKKKYRGGMKSLFLSPLGYQVHTKEQIAAQVEFEKSLDLDLMSAREKEFQEQNQQQERPKKKGNRYKARSRRQLPPSPDKQTGNPENDEVEDSINPRYLEEDGRIITGKLSDFSIPSNHRLAWFTCAQEDQVLKSIKNPSEISNLLNQRTELFPETLPPTGFFGLHLPEIRKRCEGLILTAAGGLLDSISTVCPEYEFLDSEAALAFVLADVEVGRARIRALQEGERRLRQVIMDLVQSMDVSVASLLESRWVPWADPDSQYSVNGFRISKMVETSAMEVVSEEEKVVAEGKIGFIPLFPPRLESEQGESLLCVWDALEALAGPAQPPTMTLHDLVKSLEPPSDQFTTFGQAVFDETCCSLTEALVLQFRRSGGFVSEKDWQDVLLSRPLNVLTWQQLGLEAIRLLSLPMSVAQFRKCLGLQWGRGLEAKWDVLSLVYNHPFVSGFCTSVGGGVGKEEVELRKEVFLSFEGLRDSLIEGQEGEENLEVQVEVQQDLEGFCERIKEVFLKVLRFEGKITESYVVLAGIILNWFEGLCEELGIKLTPTEVIKPFSNQLTGSQIPGPKRTWGSYLARCGVEASTHVLLPFHFRDPKTVSLVEERFKAFERLYKCIFLLKSSEPEHWNANDRITVYLTLVDYCYCQEENIRDIHTRQNLSKKNTTNAHLSKDLITFLPAERKKSNFQCVFTGLKAHEVEDHVDWVEVPEEFIPAEKHSGNHLTQEEQDGKVKRSSNLRNPGNQASTVGNKAIRVAFEQVKIARDKAKRENSIEMDLRQELISALSITGGLFSSPQLDQKKPSYHRAVPIGFDKEHCSYWLLEAQSKVSLFDFTESGTAICSNNTKGNSTEPFVLMKKPNGWWGYFSDTNRFLGLIEGFNDENENERKLKTALMEKFYHTKSSLLKTGLYINVFQKDFIARKYKAEIMQFTKLSEHVELQHKLRLMEIAWGKAFEIRTFLLQSTLYKNEQEPSKNLVRIKEAFTRKQKKMRDTILWDIYDHHYSKGWLRRDVLNRIRQLSAVTTATNLHAEPSAYSYICTNLKRSGFLKLMPLPPANPPVPDNTIVPTSVIGDNKNPSVPVENPVESSDKPPTEVSPPTEKPTEENSVSKQTETVKESSSMAYHVETKTGEVKTDVRSAETGLGDQRGDDKPEKNTGNLEPLPKPEGSQVGSQLGSDRPGESQESEDIDIDPNLANSRGKAVEQLHIITGEVLRVYPSGKDAALFMNVSKSGISVCCNGTKADNYGFKWRLYKGPPIDWEAIKPKQTPLEQLKQMQVSRNKSIDFDLKAEQERISRLKLEALAKNGLPRPPNPAPLRLPSVTLSSNRTTNASRSAAGAGSRMVPTMGIASQPSTYVPRIPQKPINVSMVEVDIRLLRLKSELLNVFYILPEKALKFAALDEKSEKEIEAAGDAATLAIHEGVEKLKADDDKEAQAYLKDIEGENKLTADGEISQDYLSKLTDKASRKAKRRLRRKLALESFLKMVQFATTATQLMDIVVQLEQALAPALMYSYPKSLFHYPEGPKKAPVLELLQEVRGERRSKALPAVTSSAVAQRIFTLDRAMRYDEIKGVDTASIECPYKLRTLFVPRCLISSNCVRFLCHNGRCLYTEKASRFDENLYSPTANNTFMDRRSVPVTTSSQPSSGQTAKYVPGTSSTYSGSSQVRGTVGGGYTGRRDEDEPISEFMRKLGLFKKEPDVESVLGYVPKQQEITAFEWV